MARYTMGEVKINGNYPIKEILELSMDVGVNRHGFLTYGGLVAKDEAKRFIQQNADGQAVRIYLRGEMEFYGCPQDIAVENQGEHCYLRVTLVTSSQLMDTELCNRFYQDTDYTFKDILTESYDDSGLGSIVAIRGKDKIKTPILQYRETDWQFTLRMAGRLGTIVVPDPTAKEPQIVLGVPHRQPIDETNNIAYSIGRNATEYKRKYAIYESSSRSIIALNDIGFQSFLCYTMKSNNRYKLGDSVRVDGKVLAVMRKSFVYEQGEIQELYILGHEHEFSVPYHHNKHIAGLELEGKVLNRSGQEIQLLLDIDENRKDCGKTWFSYAPVTNNGMYSMPLEDEKVMLQWQGQADSDVLIVRPERINSQDTQPPSERHFQTDCENHLMMIPNKVEYTNPVGSMKWLASKGFDISTSKNMSISAQQNVSIKSQARIDVNSPERITVCKAGVESSIDMLSNELHIKAVRKVKATSKANQYKKTKLPERMQSFTINTETASKLAAAIPQVSNAKK